MFTNYVPSDSSYIRNPALTFPEKEYLSYAVAIWEPFLQTIPTKGGVISVGDSSMEVHPNAFTETTKVWGKLEIDHTKWPPHYTGVTAMLYVNTENELLIPATLRMPSWCSHDDKEKEVVMAHVLHGSEKTSTWNVIKQIPLSSEKVFQFDCRDFSPVVVGIPKQSDGEIQVHVDGQIYASPLNVFTLIFYKQSKLRERDIEESMSRNRCIRQIRFSTIQIKPQDKVQAFLQVIGTKGFILRPEEPFEFNFPCNDPDGGLVKLKQISLYKRNFEILEFHDDHGDVIKMESLLKKENEIIDGRHGFPYFWKDYRFAVPAVKNIHHASPYHGTQPAVQYPSTPYQQSHGMPVSMMNQYGISGYPEEMQHQPAHHHHSGYLPSMDANFPYVSSGHNLLPRSGHYNAQQQRFSGPPTLPSLADIYDERHQSPQHPYQQGYDTMLDPNSQQASYGQPSRPQLFQQWHQGHSYSSVPEPQWRQPSSHPSIPSLQQKPQEHHTAQQLFQRPLFTIDQRGYDVHSDPNSQQAWWSQPRSLQSHQQEHHRRPYVPLQPPQQPSFYPSVMPSQQAAQEYYDAQQTPQRSIFTKVKGLQPSHNQERRMGEQQEIKTARLQLDPSARVALDVHNRDSNSEIHSMPRWSDNQTEHKGHSTRVKDVQSQPTVLGPNTSLDSNSQQAFHGQPISQMFGQWAQGNPYSSIMPQQQQQPSSYPSIPPLQQKLQEHHTAQQLPQRPLPSTDEHQQDLISLQACRNQARPLQNLQQEYHAHFNVQLPQQLQQPSLSPSVLPSEQEAQICDSQRPPQRSLLTYQHQQVQKIHSRQYQGSRKLMTEPSTQVVPHDFQIDQPSTSGFSKARKRPPSNGGPGLNQGYQMLQREDQTLPHPHSLISDQPSTSGLRKRKRPQSGGLMQGYDTSSLDPNSQQSSHGQPIPLPILQQQHQIDSYSSIMPRQQHQPSYPSISPLQQKPQEHYHVQQIPQRTLPTTAQHQQGYDTHLDLSARQARWGQPRYLQSLQQQQHGNRYVRMPQQLHQPLFFPSVVPSQQGAQSYYSQQPLQRSVVKNLHQQVEGLQPCHNQGTRIGQQIGTDWKEQQGMMTTLFQPDPSTQLVPPGVHNRESNSEIHYISQGSSNQTQHQGHSTLVKDFESQATLPAEMATVGATPTRRHLDLTLNKDDVQLKDQQSAALNIALHLTVNNADHHNDNRSHVERTTIAQNLADNQSHLDINQTNSTNRQEVRLKTDEEKDASSRPDGDDSTGKPKD